MKAMWIIGIAAAGLIAPTVAEAQGQVTGFAVAEGRKVEIEQAAAGRGGAIFVETKLTTGRPYSAESISETVQALADGNRINRRTATRVYRDGEGRTRRETLADDGTVRSIAISDPVARTSFTLDPATRTARKSGNPVSTFRTAEGTYSVSIAPTVKAEQERELVVARGAGAGGGGAAAGGARGGGGGGGRGGATLARRLAVENPNVRKEELPAQSIEGVMASGSRTTTVIPAGEIGNVQEIRVVSEQWFSEELQLLVMTRHNDPRSGETTYRLRNIVRAEPDPSLFTVPPDYTVQEPVIRRQE